MTLKRSLSSLFMVFIVSLLSAVTAAKSYDVLELPAVKSELAARSLIYSIREFDGRYFATGHRGHILYSDDGGDTWTQAEVPVRSSIVDIDFATPELGWAVGHEGVILHSSDGGKTWVKQYDGIRYGQEGLTFYQRLAEENPDNDLYPYLVEEMEFSIAQGADKPLFRVLFHTPEFGHVGGAYGMMLRTEDGGETWIPVLHNMANDSFFHVFDISPLPGPGRFFLSGEAGLFMVGDINARKAVAVENVPWEGSFFTSDAAQDDAIVLGGLRGRMFRTVDEGQTWEEVEKPPTSSIVASTRLPDGRLVFAGIAGELLISDDNGMSFSLLPVSSGNRIYTVAAGPEGTLLVGGPAGIQKLKLPQ